MFDLFGFTIKRSFLIEGGNMSKTTRRDFFIQTGKSAALLTIGSTLSKCAQPGESASGSGDEKLKRLELGMASYTFRKFSLEDTLAMTQRLGLQHIALKSFHLPLDADEATIQAVAARVKAAGLDLYGGGVIYMKNKEEVDRAFMYARTAGMKVIIGVPEPDLLELVHQKVQEYNIKLAIHNHGPGDQRYPTPESAYEKIKDMDSRMGLCIDIGHTRRAGIDPANDAEKYAARLHDVHIKDVNVADKTGTTVEIGRGVIDIPKFLRTLIKINYQGNVSLEFEKDAENPLAGAAESIGYIRGVLSVI